MLDEIFGWNCKHGLYLGDPIHYLFANDNVLGRVLLFARVHFLFLACGYRLPDEILVKMMEYLDTKNLPKVDVNMLLMGIRWYKDQQLTNDNEGDVDEYLDAFVALGGDPDKDGFISKDVLVEIIKTEFELTIDMVVSKTPINQLWRV